MIEGTAVTTSHPVAHRVYDPLLRLLHASLALAAAHTVGYRRAARVRWRDLWHPTLWKDSVKRLRLTNTHGQATIRLPV